MKILVVGMSEILGGVERVVLSVINGCLDEISFDFLCFGDNYPYQSDYPNSVFYYIPRRRENFKESQRKQELFWKNEGRKYDVIWINTSSASNITSYRFAKKYTQAKIVSHSHGSKIEHNSNMLRSAHNILHFLNRNKLVSLSDKLIACSKNAAEHLYGKAAKKAQIVYNGIDTQSFTFDSKNRKRVRDELGIHERTIVLICVGRIEKVKNFLYAVKVFQYLVRTAPCFKARLIIIGDGSESKTISNYIEHNSIDGVYMLGYKPDVKPYLDASDIFLQPSFFEGFPVSVIEAQANGLKCIISNKVTKEVEVTDLVHFLDINDKDICEWAKEIIDSEQIIDRIAYNRMIHQQGFDAQNVINEMKKVFFSVE